MALEKRINKIYSIRRKNLAKQNAVLAESNYLSTRFTG